MWGERGGPRGDVSLLVLGSNNTVSSTSDWAPEILAHLKPIPKGQCVSEHTNPYSLTAKKNSEVVQSKTNKHWWEFLKQSLDAFQCNEMTAEKCSRSFTKLRMDLPLTTADYSGGRFAQTPSKQRENSPHPAPARPALAPQLSNSNFSNGGTSYQENLIGIICLPA